MKYGDRFDSLLTAVRLGADQELMSRFNRAEVRYKADGSTLTDADIAMNQWLIRELGERFPDYSVLSEEMPIEVQQQRLAAAEPGLWVIDPLDGTSNFAAGLPYFAVSMALMEEGRVSFALVYDPVRRECFHARPGQGAWVNERRLIAPSSQRSLRRAIALVDFKRLPTELAQRLVAAPPYASQRSFGAVALDLCWLAAGRAHIYLHGQHNLWDYIAGLSILREAGGRDQTLESMESQPFDIQPRSSAAALHAELFREWCDWLGLH